MINMYFDPSSALAKLDSIKHIADEAIRPAAQAGAQVFYDEVKIRAKRGNETRYLKRKGSPTPRTRPAGLLAASIYQVYSKDESGPGRATYHISWNKGKAPHGKFVEFGTSKRAKHPFLRPSYDAMRATAEAAVIAELQKRLKGAL